MFKLTPFPTFVRYSDDLPDGVGGHARYCFVTLRPKYKDDAGIHAHEYKHVTQFYVPFLVWLVFCVLVSIFTPSDLYVLPLACIPFGVCFHPLFYWLVPEYKLACEVEAYREQANHYTDDRLPIFAKFIARDYGLAISEEAAKSALI